MVKKLLLLFFLLKVNCSFTQTGYVPLIAENKIWIYSNVEDDETSFKTRNVFALKYKGDTIVQQIKYNKLLRFGLETKQILVGMQMEIIAKLPYKTTGNGSLYALMREDTASKKIFILPIENKEELCNENETVQFDFNLKTGDKMNECISSTVEQNGSEATVDTVIYDYAINPNSGSLYVPDKRRHWLFEGFFPIPGLKFKRTQAIIEGVGAQMYGVVAHTWKGNPLVVFNGYCEDTTASCILLDVQEENNEVGIVCTNPVIHRLQIAAQLSVEEIYIYTTSGNLLISKKEPDIKEIDLSFIPPSLLVLKVKLSNGKQIVKKIVKI